MRGKDIFALLLNHVAAFFAVGAVLWLAVIAVNLIPNAPIMRHVLPTLMRQQSDYAALGTRTWVLDDYTDCIADTIGVSDTKNVIVRSLESRTLDDCPDARHNLAIGAPGRNYWRYWHGYQLISRPALALMPPEALRDINQMMFVGAWLTFMAFAALRFGPAPALAGVAAAALIPMFSQFSLITHGAIWIETFLLSAYLLHTQGKAPLPLSVLFMFQGMMTSFLDFLTTPVIGLTIPLVVLCLFWRREQMPLPQQIRQLIACSFAWTIGFLAFWVAKWALALWLVPGADLANLITVMTHRASSAADDLATGRQVGRFDAIKMLLWQARYACVVVGVLAIAALAKAYMAKKLRLDMSLVPLALVASVPAAWALVVLNHSFVHYFFVTPILAPSLFIVAFLSLDYLLTAARLQRAQSAQA